MLGAVHPAVLPHGYCWEPAQRCARGCRDPPLPPPLPTHIPTPVALAHSRVSAEWGRRCWTHSNNQMGSTLMFPEELFPLG